MASATDTANPDTAPRRGLRGRFGRSRLGRTIILLNLLGLVVIVVGSLVLSGYRKVLIQTNRDYLESQGTLIAGLIEQAGTTDEPALDLHATNLILQAMAIDSKIQRVRLFDANLDVIYDSDFIADRIETSSLPPARKRGQPPPRSEPSDSDQLGHALAAEIIRARSTGVSQSSGLRKADNGQTVVSVSIPIQRVKAVLGVLTLERRDVDRIVALQRLALLPFILVAVLVTLATSFILYRLVAEPVLRLAAAADRVRLSRSRSITLPRLERRQDELGDLARALSAMTAALTSRIDAIDRFAADVAHEIKNPLTSIASALETLDLVKDDTARKRLISIIGQDVRRLDRLVTDISNASRLDAELSRESPHPVDLSSLLREIAGLYEAGRKAGEAHVATAKTFASHVMVSGREGPLGQVARNLIDNARSFSPADGEVRVGLSHGAGAAVFSVEDDGPGIPPENLETVFERFYTSRPKGAKFGGNSGLGLSIARQIVEAHGGTISAENRTDDVGRVLGARFIVTLPEFRA